MGSLNRLERALGRYAIPNLALYLIGGQVMFLGFALLAQFNLGLRYGDGLGVPKDPVRAYAWINLAAANNAPDGSKVRDAMERLLTLEQKAEAQKLSAELFEKTKKRQ